MSLCDSYDDPYDYLSDDEDEDCPDSSLGGFYNDPHPDSPALDPPWWEYR